MPSLPRPTLFLLIEDLKARLIPGVVVGERLLGIDRCCSPVNRIFHLGFQVVDPPLSRKHIRANIRTKHLAAIPALFNVFFMGLAIEAAERSTSLNKIIVQKLS